MGALRSATREGGFYATTTRARDGGRSVGRSVGRSRSVSVGRTSRFESIRSRSRSRSTRLDSIASTRLDRLDRVDRLIRPFASIDRSIARAFARSRPRLRRGFYVVPVVLAPSKRDRSTSCTPRRSLPFARARGRVHDSIDRDSLIRRTTDRTRARDRPTTTPLARRTSNDKSRSLALDRRHTRDRS